MLFAKLLSTVLAFCMFSSASANGRYNFAVLYQTESDHADCSAVEDLLFRVTTLSLIGAGVDLDEQPEHWDNYVTEYHDMVAVANGQRALVSKNEEDGQELEISEGDEGRELMKITEGACYGLCQMTGLDVYCHCCGERCGRGRRALKVGMRNGYTSENMATVIRKAEAKALHYLNLIDEPLECLHYDAADPHYKVTIRMAKLDNEPGSPCCPPGHTGWLPFDRCTQFYHCFQGALEGLPQACPEGLLYDADSHICNWPGQVTCEGNAMCL